VFGAIAFGHKASMAHVVSIRGTDATAKLRSPWAVFGLTFLTLGIYYLVWYYKINRELRDLGRATGQEDRLGRSPLTSLAAITLGWLIIVPPFVSFWKTMKRVEAAQEIAGVPGNHASAVLGIVLYVIGFLFLPVEVVYVQEELNKGWREGTSTAA
jgi:hypothetical protein